MGCNILVIAPHADDEVLGCGGTIAKHAHFGDSVHILIATNASIGAPELFPTDEILQIRDEARTAHELLGVTKTHFLDLPAPALNSYPAYKISLEMGKIIEQITPRIVYLPYPGDMHKDHEAIYRSALVAIRPHTTANVSEVLCYETLSETEWTPCVGDKAFQPNVFIDIEAFLEKKLDAIRCFKSQLKDFPNPRSEEAIVALSKYRGATVHVKSAEAFSLERSIR